jgi:hypothetical protein
MGSDLMSKVRSHDVCSDDERALRFLSGKWSLGWG